MDALREKINRLIEEASLDLKNVSLKMKRNSTYLHHFIHRGSPRVLAEKDRIKLADILGVGEDELLDDAQRAERRQSLRPIVTGEYTEIPVYDITASAGPGNVNDREKVIYHHSFRTQWLRQITRAPINKLAVIRVTGDSMMPTIANDDSALIDMTQTYPRADGIYAVCYDDALLIKRVRIDPVRRTAIILSDNGFYPPVENIDPEQIQVAGKVIWLGRRV